MDDMLEMDARQPILQGLQCLVIIAFKCVAGFIIGKVYGHHHSNCRVPVDPED
mgnify:CR=1 FL=1